MTGTQPQAASAAPKRPRVARQRPRWTELREVLQLRRPTLNPVERRLGAALTIGDLRAVAVRTTPRAVFDYVDGAADAELTARRSRAAFAAVELVPEYLSPVDHPDLSTRLFGREIAMPLIFAPTGYTRMMHHEGEAAVARVAARHGLPYALSTVGTSTVEDVAAAAPGGEHWFQLYLTRNERLNAELLDRALAAGFTTVVLTVDTPVAGRHPKDMRNGLTIPPSLTLRTLFGMARYPSWALNKLTTAPITFASLSGMGGGVSGVSGDTIDAVRVADVVFEPTLSYEHLAWLRAHWPYRLLVKGVLSPRDARRVVEGGADGVIVSNHGGRQLDRTPATLTVLPGIREELGPDATVILDSGVTHGQDILAARALGADAVMIGRAYLYGLMAGGERGVERAVTILREEYARSLQLLGLKASDAIARHHLRMP
ncbi:FMN-dependent alpha-hydroxy acid dehydrogenase [Streptomyces violaceusniger Tu 4113]|uniref:FMN-dependent alpha-hydroxy acid dehydrogenase n=1 Tax=Streptomyces violaceusniger (strain Tu 4113) TaxID=653045 RepID=G2PGI2_STRV4|nr:FMN-dependent alpha-hydroxy acid dehydrogenase [Streptomyces violaceusniger Tu 4113]